MGRQTTATLDVTNAHHAQPASKWILVGWVALMAVVAISIPVSSELVGDFGGPGSRVLIRGWMQLTNRCLLLAHGVVLLLVCIGCWRTARRQRRPWAWLAAALASSALVAVAAAAALDPVLGPGPFEVGADALWWLRAGVFVPSVVRCVAWLGISTAFVRAAPVRLLLTLLILVDLTICLTLWGDTPLAVIALEHPAAGAHAAWTLPFFAGSCVFVGAMFRQALPTTGRL